MQIGIDLGGSHVGVGIVNENGKIVAKQEQDLNTSHFTAEENKEYIRDTMVSLINQVVRQVGAPTCLIHKIGIAAPGTVKNGTIYRAYNLGIKELAIEEALKQYYEVDVIARNDAKCAGLAEKKYGSLKDYEDSVFLCLGTGIGGATFLGGKLVQPRKNAGSEYGHMIIKKDGNLCKCGNKGCFETYNSMRVFKENIRKILDLEEAVTSEEILKALIENKQVEAVNNYIDVFIDDLLLGISNICNIMEPEAICLGGSFVYYEKILYTRLIEKLQSTIYQFNKPEIVLAKLGNDAGIIGAVVE
ncbi:MAG: ROK family protein [Clostridia bacterium]